MRRGILGGTFDPPHIAHLFAAESAYRKLGLDVVTFIPAGDPWQKSDRVVATAADRLAMTGLAVEPISYFEVDSREVDRVGPTYTADTLAELEDDDVVLILGSDAAAGLMTWHRPDVVLGKAELAVVPRPGTPREAVAEAVPGAFHWIDGPELDISGTMLRSRVGAGMTIRFLLPEAVAGYIEAHGLYSDVGSPASQ